MPPLCTPDVTVTHRGWLSECQPSAKACGWQCGGTQAVAADTPRAMKSSGANRRKLYEIGCVNGRTLLHAHNTGTCICGALFDLRAPPPPPGWHGMRSCFQTVCRRKNKQTFSVARPSGLNQTEVCAPEARIFTRQQCHCASAGRFLWPHSTCTALPCDLRVHGTVPPWHTLSVPQTQALDLSHALTFTPTAPPVSSRIGG